MAACSPVACQVSVMVSPGLIVAGLMVNEAMPTGKAVAAGGNVGGTVAASVAPGAGPVLVSEAISVEVAGAGKAVPVGGGLLGASVALGAGEVSVAEAGAQILAVAVTIAIAVADGAARVAGGAVAVMSAEVGGFGVSVATTQAEHSTATISDNQPGCRRPMLSLYS